MDELRRNLKSALRLLWRRADFTLISVASLALGLGANTVLFSLIHEIFFESLPIAEGERVMVIYGTDEKVHDRLGISHLNWKDLREQTTTFAEMASYTWSRMAVAVGKGEPFPITGQLVSGNYFTTLGVEAALGRTMTAAGDEVTGHDSVVVLSDRFWRRQMGERDDVMGETLRLNGHPFTVVGVTPPEFEGLLVGFHPDLWVPMATWRQAATGRHRALYETRSAMFLQAFGRLSPGIDNAEAEAELRLIAGHLEREFPDENRGRSVRAVPIRTARVPAWLRDDATAGTALLLATVGLVLLIACVNIANLLLARAAERGLQPGGPHRERSGASRRHAGARGRCARVPGAARAHRDALAGLRRRPVGGRDAARDRRHGAPRESVAGGGGARPRLGGGFLGEPVDREESPFRTGL